MNEFAQFSTLSFDCYGTLIDWESGIAAAMRPWSGRAGLALSDAELVGAHGRHETLVQQANPTMPYSAILAEVLRLVGAEFDVPVSDHDAQAYGESVRDWPAFGDSVESLARLKNRYRLVILSNIDRASFAHSNKRLGVHFDMIITAEDVGSYKPNLNNFKSMFSRLGDIGSDRSDLLHVAESLYHDHEPAKRLNLPSVWIHRRHEKEGSGATAQPLTQIEPRWRFTSLRSFADAALDD